MAPVSYDQDNTWLQPVMTRTTRGSSQCGPGQHVAPVSVDQDNTWLQSVWTRVRSYKLKWNSLTNITHSTRVVVLVF